MPTVLIAGANGLVGRHVAGAFWGEPGWRVVTIGRHATAGRGPDAPDPHLAVDLLDAAAVHDAVAAQPDVTHLVFSARGARDADVTMLANVLAAFRESPALLRHVTMFQSARAYGGGFGPYKIPAKESDPRLPVPEVCDEQLDVLVEAAASDGFRWTALRADTVIGYAAGNPRNLLMVLAVYASVCRARGLPLRFPGTEDQYRCLAQVTDANLLGRAAVWAAGSEAAADDVFNVTNGDAFRWCDLWPRIADAFGIGVAPPSPFSLVDAMGGNGDVWDWLVNQYELVPSKWEDLVDWAFGDAVLRAGFDRLYSTVKVRAAGFGDAYDSEDRFTDWLSRLASERVIPPLEP